MWFLIFMLNLPRFELDFFPVGGCLIQGDRVYLSDLKGHQAITLNLQLGVLSRSDGHPRQFSFPMRVFKGPDQQIGIFDMGTHTILTFEKGLVEPTGALRVGGIPIGQSAKNPEIVAFLDDEAIWQTRLWADTGFSAVQNVGGKVGKRNRALGRFFEDHLVIPFGNGKVLWADSLDMELFFDRRSILRLEFEDTLIKLPNRADLFQRVIPSIYRFYHPGCFSFLQDGFEKAVVTVAHPYTADKGYTVYVINDQGDIGYAGTGDWFPLGFGEPGWLICNGDVIQWGASPEGNDL